MSETREKSVNEIARDRFKRCAEAEDPQRKSILECKQFRSGNQWPEEVKIQRQGGPALQGQAAQPPRPMLTIDRISQPTRLVSNSVKAANFAINVQPNGYGADDDTAAIQKGLLRWIQNRARPEAPVDWAADGAAEGGLGWFRIYAEYSRNDWPETGQFDEAYFDQDLCLGRISNSLTVYCDPSAKTPTRRDAKFMFVTEDLARDEFTRLYPTADISALDEFRATGDNQAWITEDTVRVAEYWTVDYEKKELVELAGPDGQSVFMAADQMPKDTPKDAIKTRRTLFKPTVTCRKITACEVLEDYEWRGRRIPLFPVLGEELNVDGQTILRGIIAPAMDAQRMVNYMYSAAIETVALAPKAPLIVAEGQVERYQQIWQNANRFNYSYLPYTPVSLLGNPVPPPQRDQAEAPIQAMVVMLEKSEEGVKATTATYSQALGQGASQESGRKVLALQKQTEQTNSNYIDNVITTLTEAGDELVYLLPQYYNRPGRIVQILGIDDQPEQVMLGAAYKATPQGPQAMPEVTREMAQAQKGLAKFYDLTAGRYATTVMVGKSFTTKREEGAQVLGEMLSANPGLLKVFGDLFFRDLDIPGAQEIAERMKKLLDPAVQKAGKGEEPTPKELQQQIQQAGQMIQALSKELAARTQAMETDQVKQHGEMQREQFTQAEETKRAVLKAQSDYDIKKLQLVADLLKTRATLEMQQTEAMIDREVQQLDGEVARAGEATQRQEATSEADKDREIGQSEAERDRQHELTLAEHQAQAQNSQPA